MDLLCDLGTLVGGALQSWRSFKLLKQRERLHVQIEQCADEEAALDLRVELQLAKRAVRDVLRFWTVYALLLLWDTYLDALASWVPLYYTLKLALVLWLMAANGATFIFAHAVEPFLDRHAEYIDGTLLPQLRGVWLRAQDTFVGGFVALAKAAGSDDQLERLQRRLEDMIDDIEREKKARRTAALAHHHAHEHRHRRSSRESKLSDHNGDVNDEARAQDAPATTSGVMSGALSAAWGLASSTLWTRAQLDTVSEQKDGEGSEATDQSGWVRGALDGMVGLTLGTRDLLMGNALPDAASPSPLPSRHAPHQSRTAMHKGRLLDEYGPGFEDLSDCDDKDDEEYAFCNDPMDLPHAPEEAEAGDEMEMDAEEDSAGQRSARRSGKTSSSVAEMRRRRPQTRSQGTSSKR